MSDGQCLIHPALTRIQWHSGAGYWAILCGTSKRAFLRLPFAEIGTAHHHGGDLTVFQSVQELIQVVEGIQSDLQDASVHSSLIQKVLSFLTQFFLWIVLCIQTFIFNGTFWKIEELGAKMTGERQLLEQLMELSSRSSQLQELDLSKVDVVVRNFFRQTKLFGR